MYLISIIALEPDEGLNVFLSGGKWPFTNLLDFACNPCYSIRDDTTEKFNVLFEDLTLSRFALESRLC